MSDIRVRSAPSNTGPDIHAGNCRTILLNHLFARRYGGRTVFRIEDSDIARSKIEYADAIADTLNWVGLRADEGYGIGGDYGPYLQTQKLARYKAVANELIERGVAYRCYCTQEELTNLRNQLPEKQRQTFRYPGICRDRKDYPANKGYVVRLKAPTEGAIEWDDLVFGKIVVPNKENYDWVLMRDNGIPLYNFGCVIDDYDQKITHIIRGRDHMINNPIQIMLHQLLGSQEIRYAHLPMMLGQDKSKLSKRHGSCTITEYKNAGYTPSAILNYLCRFGWGYGNQEIFSMDDLISKFSLEGCGKNDGCFDPKKFASIQYEHLKTPALVSDKDYSTHLLPHIEKLGLTTTIDHLTTLIPLTRTRSKTLVEAANELLPILIPTTNLPIDPAAKEKFITVDTKPLLELMTTWLSGIEVWDEETIRATITKQLEDKLLTLKDISQPIRVCLTGRTNSPDLFAVMVALGKWETIERIHEHIR